MRYLPFEEADQISASLELIDKAIFDSMAVHDAFEYEFSDDTGTVKAYESPETPRMGKAIGILDKNWYFRLGISGKDPRQVVFKVDVKGIYNARAEYSNYRTSKKRKEELGHFIAWLDEVSDCDWE